MFGGITLPLIVLVYVEKMKHQENETFCIFQKGADY